MNKTITLKKTDTTENMAILAHLKGYTSSLKNEVEKKVSIKEATENDFQIISTDGDIALVKVIEENKNTQSPEEFVAEYYQNMVDEDIKNTFVRAKKSALREKQKAEEKAIEDETAANVEKNKTEATIS